MGERKRPKVLRWFVLWVVFTALGLGWMVVGTAFLVGGTAFGVGTVDLGTEGRHEFEAGDEFSLTPKDDGYFTCQVVPDRGETREMVLSKSRHYTRHATDATGEVAWFDGPARITCEHPVTMRTPGDFTATHVTRYVSIGLLTAGAACLLYGGFRLFQRGQAHRRSVGAIR